MFIRPPVQGPLANSNARLALVMRSPRGTRVLEIGNRTITAILLLASLLMAWYLVATLYLVLRDDALASLLEAPRANQIAYEERIAELRARIDRITAKQVVNQDSVEDRVAAIVARQAELEARQVMVADLGARASGIGIATRTTPFAPDSTEQPTGSVALPFAADGARKPRPLPNDPIAPTGSPRGFETPARIRGPMDGIVKEVERRSERMEKAQIDVLKTIGSAAEEEISRGRRLIAAVGIDPARFGKTALTSAPIRKPLSLDNLMLRDVGGDLPASGIGGPFLPASRSHQPSRMFETVISQAESAIDGARKARAIREALPVGRPLGERYDLSSGFGTRLDPFTRSLALHSGLDFRAPSGTAVRAVAAGQVIEAGPSGGYGRMVEIDHGFGITTRYAHLSSIAIEEGARIAKGTVVGHVGSTGRSTGPHLHYEVRIDDDAMDPMRFVRAERLTETN
jgi:murein DD-endopeptidase MepM/ murein hydrolase activator NlpD